jgi:TRAP-type transport system small permease protein
MKSKKVDNFLGIFSYVLSRVGCLALFMMMGFTVLDVSMRYVFNAPILGAYEITQYLIAILIFSFLGYAQAQKIHVSVDILYNVFPTGVRRGIDLLNLTVSLILMFLISWKGWEKAVDAMATGDKLMNLPVPDYPFIFFLTIGCGVMSIEFVRDIIKTFSTSGSGGLP